MKLYLVWEEGYYYASEIFHGAFTSEEKAQECLQRVIQDRTWSKEVECWISTCETDVKLEG